MHGHTPSDTPETEASHHIERRARYGLVLFALYLAIYGAFVYLNAFAPAVMAAQVGGVSLAIVYGFGLIAAAVVLALLYDFLCRRLHA